MITSDGSEREQGIRMTSNISERTAEVRVKKCQQRRIIHMMGVLV
jgi:hypothetical protein